MYCNPFHPNCFGVKIFLITCLKQKVGDEIQNSPNNYFNDKIWYVSQIDYFIINYSIKKISWVRD